MNTDSFQSENTNRMPLVSIALCVYNGENFLQEQLETLVNQSYQNLEIIAVDDCSSDSSRTILKELATRYPILKVHENEENLGYVRNFEKALSFCSGEYIALCDQDDVWDLNKIQVQIAQIGPHTLIYHDSSFIDENGNPANRKMSDIINLYSGNQPEVFLLFNCVSGHTCFFRRALLAEVLPFHPDHFHDHWIAYVAANIGSIACIPQCLVGYRQHKESSTDILNKRKKLDKTYHENRDVAKLKKDLKWLKQCVGFHANKNQPFLDQFIKLYETRLNTFFSFEYAAFLRKNYDLLFFIQKLRKGTKSGFINRQAWGLKAKIYWARLLSR